MNTYAWMKPINIENAVQTIFNAKASGPVNGDKTASCKSNPVTTSPEKILPKRRNANEATLVTSSNKFIGSIAGVGDKKPLR